jgi:hypothetical protein
MSTGVSGGEAMLAASAVAAVALTPMLDVDGGGVVNITEVPMLVLACRAWTWVAEVRLGSVVPAAAGDAGVVGVEGPGEVAGAGAISAASCVASAILSTPIWAASGELTLSSAGLGAAVARAASRAWAGLMFCTGPTTAAAPSPEIPTAWFVASETVTPGRPTGDTVIGNVTWRAVNVVCGTPPAQPSLATPPTHVTSATSRLPRIPATALGVRISITSPGFMRLFATPRASFPLVRSTAARPGSSVSVKTESSRIVTSALPPRRARTMEFSLVSIRSRTNRSSLNLSGIGWGTTGRATVACPCTVVTTPALGA